MLPIPVFTKVFALLIEVFVLVSISFTASGNTCAKILATDSVLIPSSLARAMILSNASCAVPPEFSASINAVSRETISSALSPNCVCNCGRTVSYKSSIDCLLRSILPAIFVVLSSNVLMESDNILNMSSVIRPFWFN